MSDVHETECATHKGWHGETPCAWCMQTEIDRLQKDVIHWREARRSCIEAGDMMKAEIERLRKALASSCDEQRQLYREEANWPCEAAMDNEVLRELLRDILEAEDLPAHWWLRIREALGDE